MQENIDRYDDRDDIHVNLLESYDRFMAFVSKHLPDKFYLANDQRINIRDEALMLKGAVTSSSTIDLYIIPLGTGKDCLKLAARLRSERLKVDIEMSNRKLKKSLDFANKQGVPYVVIFGENELKSGAVMLKDMLKGSEFEVELDELVLRIKDMLGKMEG